MTDRLSDNDTTRAVARLPGLDIEVTHSKSPEAERISIHLEATPSFDAFGRFLEAGNPFAFWAQVTHQTMQMMWMPWAPWLNATRALLPPTLAGEAPPTVPRT